MGYHRRLGAETAMFRLKTPQEAHMNLRDYDAQVGEIMVIMVLLVMPKSI